MQGGGREGGDNGGYIKVSIREKEVKGSLSEVACSSQVSLPFALGEVSGRKLSKPNPYSIIFIEHQLSRNGRKRRHNPAHRWALSGGEGRQPPWRFHPYTLWLLCSLHLLDITHVPSTWEATGRTG